jgi:hypothetical protein
MSAVSVRDAYDRLRAMIGASGPASRGTVLVRDIERFAVASGDDDPAYAAAAGGRSLSPLLLLSSVIEWRSGPPLDELREDGTGVGREGWLPLAGLRLMGGGQDLVFHADVLSDQSFTAVPTLEDVQLKEGGTGALLLLTITTEYRAPDGASLLTCRETLIAR